MTHEWPKRVSMFTRIGRRKKRSGHHACRTRGRNRSRRQTLKQAPEPAWISRSPLLSATHPWPKRTSLVHPHSLCVAQLHPSLTRRSLTRTLRRPRISSSLPAPSRATTPSYSLRSCFRVANWRSCSRTRLPLLPYRVRHSLLHSLPLQRSFVQYLPRGARPDHRSNGAPEDRIRVQWPFTSHLGCLRMSVKFYRVVPRFSQWLLTLLQTS
jgi:hypothetical protein